MAGLLFPAIQKFYSALRNLEEFNAQNDFFKNISCLDTFFSEFRNITFVLQKSIKHTEHYVHYEKYRDKYLSNCKWFVDKRNETSKKHPFDLIKEMCITIYLADESIAIIHKKFTIDNDAKISIILEEIKRLFSKISFVEVFFSVDFIFVDNTQKFDFYDTLIAGIKSMELFLNDLNDAINDSGKIEDELKTQIDDLSFSKINKDMFLSIDYVYNVREDSFIIAERMAPILGNIKTPLTYPADIFSKITGHLNDNFEAFILMHVAVRKKEKLMPVIVTVFDNNTLELDCFLSNLKTTYYRKIHQIAHKIQKHDIKEIYIMAEYSMAHESVRTKIYDERLKNSISEHLVFIKVDKELNEKEYSFNIKNINDCNYISKILNRSHNRLITGINNMKPIINAFSKKKNDNL